MADLPLDFPLPVPETDDLGRYLEDTITIDWQTPSVMDCARRLLAEAATADEATVADRAAGAPGGVFAAGSTEARIARLFRFVRDDLAHSFDREPAADAGRDVHGEAALSGAFSDPAAAASARHAAASQSGLPPELFRRDIACRASEVLALGHGLCFAKSHLLAALLRFAGHPTGFCYARLADDEKPGRFVLHGFVAVHWPARDGWILLDPRGDRPASAACASSVAPAEPSERWAIRTECRFEPPFSLAYVPDPTRGESLLPFVSKRPGKRIVDWLERVPDEKTLRRTVPDALQ